LGGIGLAAGLTKLLSGGGNGPPIDGLTLPPGGFVFAFIVGTTVTVLSGLFPAWKASRVPPVAAMRDVAVDTSGHSPVRLVFGVVTVLIGALLAYLGLFTSGDNSAAKVGLAFAAIFVGVIILGPLFAAPLSRLIGAPMFSFNGRLARSNAMRNPRRTASTASALMIGVGLVVVSAVLNQSIKVSLSSAIDQTFAVDLIVDSGSFGQTGLDSSLGQRINDIDGVQSATGIEFGFAQTGSEGITVLGADLAGLTKVIHIDVDSGDLAGLSPDQVGVGRSQAKAKGWTVGTPIKATFIQGGEQEVTVGAIYNLEGQLGSGLLMSTEGFGQRFPAAQQVFNQIFVKLEPDANTAAARDQITQLVRTDFPTAKVQDLTQYKDSQTGVFDILLSIITVMLVIAIFIAVLGIVNTLLLSVYERTREIGLLRAVGMGRRQVRQVVRRESVIFSLQGTVIGTVIGFVCAWAIVRAIGQDNTVTFAVPWVLLIAMVIIAMIAGVVAAVIPAYSASRLNVLDAIATD